MAKSRFPVLGAAMPTLAEMRAIHRKLDEEEAMAEIMERDWVAELAAEGRAFVEPPHEHQWVLVPGYAVPQLPMALIWVCQCGEAKVVEYQV